jgi:2'-5' RNA ligase
MSAQGRSQARIAPEREARRVAQCASGAALRLFFALVPPDELRAALGGLAQTLARDIGGRAVPAANLHLTLAFLGDVEPARAQVLPPMLASLSSGGFTLTLDRLGEWRHAGVAWIAPGIVPAPLAALHSKLAAALSAAGFAVEARPFRPHMTLVRRRRHPLADAPTIPLEWRVDRVALMVSENARGAVRYRELGGTALVS